MWVFLSSDEWEGGFAANIAISILDVPRQGSFTGWGKDNAEYSPEIALKKDAFRENKIADEQERLTSPGYPMKALE